MRQIKLVTIPSLVILTLMLAAMHPGVVRAADDPVEIEFTGTVTRIGEPSGTFGVDVDTGNGTLAYTVYPPAEFDWELIAVGDTVAVEGTLIDNFTVQATKVEIEEEEPIEIEFTGTVTAVDEDGGTITVEVESDGGTEQYDVQVPEGFDWEGIEVGDTVEVEGWLQEDGSVIATRIVVEDEDDDDDDDDGQGDHGHYCRNVDDPDIVHPVGGAIAERYGVDYEEVMYWFCEESMGFGQIMLALQTADDGDVSYEEFLNRRLAGEGWGQIWKDLGLIGRLKDADPPEEEEAENLSTSSQNRGAANKVDKAHKTTGKPDKADKTDKADNPGKTNQSGPPDKPDKPDKQSKPDKPDKPEKPDKPGKPDKS
jgi:hypothetical protein